MRSKDSKSSESSKFSASASSQQKIIEFENNQRLLRNTGLRFGNLKHALSELLKRRQLSKIDQHGDSILKTQSANLLPNDSEVRNPIYQRKGMESKSLSDDSKIDFKTSERSEQYNRTSNQYKGLNKSNFITIH